jgi:NADH-quinone oxidoreductase subunit E
MAEQSKAAGNGGSGAGDEGAAAAGPFAFDAVSEAEIAKVLAAYPPGRQASAAVPLLHLVQRQMARTTGSAWVPPAAVAEVARRLGMAPVRVQELVSFYTMFATRPVGRYHLQVCTTTPCWLRGSDEVVRACRKATGIAGWGDSADGLFTLT